MFEFVSSWQVGADLPRPLEIGIGVVHRSGEAASLPTAAGELVTRALRAVNTQRLLVRGVLLLATADWCHFASALPAAVRQSLLSSLGYPVPLIGGSMARILCLTDPEPEIEHGLVLVALCSNELHITVDHLRNPLQGSEEERRQRLGRLAGELTKRAGVRLGTGAERYLFGILPGIMRDAQGEPAYYDNELYHDVLDAFAFNYRLVGGSAADSMQPTTGYQFADDECLESGLALALIESELSSGTMIGHGFHKRSDVRVSVDELAGGAASGYEVSRLDGQPARERLRELARQGLTWCRRPLFGVPAGPECDTVVALPPWDGPGETVRFSRKVSLHDRLYLLDATCEEMLTEGARLLEGAQENAGAEVNDLCLILVFACTARVEEFELQQRPWLEMVKQTRSRYPGIPILGMLCAGEFGVDRWRHPRSNNLSVSMCCLTTAPANRMRTRTVESRLLRYANRLSLCATPKEVMKATLEGAVAAGGTGGQICIVDYTLGSNGQIVGLDLGCAHQPPGSPHKWSEVAKLTDRPASKPIGGDFPSSLRAWARPVQPDIRLKLVPVLENEVDILTLIVRTLHAVFVLDTHDRMFACDPRAADAGGIKTHLAIPMVGSHGRAIATLQVSFDDDTVLDNESFDAWIGYAQKAAVALERSQEAEELRVTQAITNLANVILQEPVPRRGGPTMWCDRYLRGVKAEIHADDAHVRVLSTGPKGDEYRLASAVGFLADLRVKTRPVIREGEGSCNRQLLMQGGVICNRKHDMAKLNSAVKPLCEAETYGDEFLRKLGELEATAMLPLIHEGELFGSFVIDSKQRYFFTERRSRIVRTAAATAAAVFSAKTTAHERAWLDSELQWTLRTLAETTQTSATERLRHLVSRLQRVLKADVASVYIWHQSASRFVLHVGTNWDTPMEGQAAYRLGDGWTGSLPYAKQEVSIVSPTSPDAKLLTGKYLTQMFPPSRRAAGDNREARVGVRLGDASQPVGVVTFAYYPEHIDSLVGENDRNVRILEAFLRLLTLAVESVKRETELQRIRTLADAKDVIADRLLRTAEPEGIWQPVVDTIRERFSVERACFYPLRENMIESDCCSLAPGTTCSADSFAPLNPFGVLRDIVYLKRSICASQETGPHIIEQWPNRPGIRSLLAVPVVSSHGEVRGILELVNRIPDLDHPYDAFDPHEQRAAEDVARALGTAIIQRENLVQAAQLQGKLATAIRIGAAALSGAMMMHRLMTPFALIQGSVDWLRLHPDAPQTERETHLAAIEEFCSQTTDMIQQTVALTAADKRRTSIRAIVKQALQAMRPTIDGTRITLDVHNDIAAEVDVESYSIVGALVNLLSNAMDAMEGEGTLTVSTGLSDDRRTAAIRIRNPGPVVTSDQIAKFFRPFHTTKGDGHHLGFGLSIADEAIRAADGRLEMAPIEGGGVEATVSLPVAQDG